MIERNSKKHSRFIWILLSATQSQRRFMFNVQLFNHLLSLCFSVTFSIFCICFKGPFLFWVYCVFCCYIESYFHDLIKAISSIWTKHIHDSKKKSHKDVRHGTMLKQTHKIQFKYGRKRRNALKNNWLSIERILFYREL